MDSEDEDYFEEEEEEEEEDIPLVKKKNPFKECLNWVTFQWIKSPTGFLKIFQFGTLLMGLIMIGSVTTGERISMEFFVFVMTSAWVFILIIVVLNILDVYQKIPKLLTNNMMLFIGCGKQRCILLTNKKYCLNIIITFK